MSLLLYFLIISRIADLSQVASGPAWGFFGHQKINYHAVFLLPPEMLVLFKPGIETIRELSVAPDKRRYLVEAEGPRHYIDMDKYGAYPYPGLPRSWKEASEKYGSDSLQKHGIVPWWIQIMLQRLTRAFSVRDPVAILRTAAELGHYVADAHVPLHTSSNHNGQHTGQRGIHGFWESRIPELLAEKEWDFVLNAARYIDDPLKQAWSVVLESAAAADSVLWLEKKLSQTFPADQQFAFEIRKGIAVRQYASDYTRAYDRLLNGMVERRMRQSIEAVASYWYTAWVNAGQPVLGKTISE
ncbi:hypothetical protein JMG10_00135 [Nostoc ellipsosporum NOK]|nr:hypothetical protein [Nostoc ellipsosporum NOK]